MDSLNSFGLSGVYSSVRHHPRCRGQGVLPEEEEIVAVNRMALEPREATE